MTSETPEPQLRYILARLRNINALHKSGLITDDERIDAHEEEVPGFREVSRRSRGEDNKGWER